MAVRPRKGLGALGERVREAGVVRAGKAGTEPSGAPPKPVCKWLRQMIQMIAVPLPIGSLSGRCGLSGSEGGMHREEQAEFLSHTLSQYVRKAAVLDLTGSQRRVATPDSRLRHSQLGEKRN